MYTNAYIMSYLSTIIFVLGNGFKKVLYTKLEYVIANSVFRIPNTEVMQEYEGNLLAELYFSMFF